MIRDLPKLASGRFDLLVVGGGVYGLAIAYDAAQRGLSVALVERGDFGGATSFNHLKTIHGGLRYLQSADLARMRESVRERRAFARIAPRFVAPLAFTIATGSSWSRNPLAMRVALIIDALVGSDRNEGLDAAHELPAGRVVGRQATWSDYQTVHGDRLTLAFGQAAAACGAVLANYTEAVTLMRDGTGRPDGVAARDTITGQTLDIRASFIVNAAGPWASAFLGRSGVTASWPLLKAMNLVTSRAAGTTAVVAPTRRGRALVLLPWQGRTLVGTSESPDTRSPDDQQARRAEVIAFVAEVNEAFPSLGLQFGEITLVHRGVVPAAGAIGNLALLGHSRIIDHAADGIDNLLSVVGVKYTTARIVAERAVDLILKKLQHPAASCRTAMTMLPGGGVNDRDADDPVAHAVREEMAHTLIDVVVRRTGLGAAGHPGDAIAADCASRMQKALGWSNERKVAELDSLRRFYEIV